MFHNKKGSAQPKGEHKFAKKLRSMEERGKGDTEAAKVFRDYLAGVSVNRGGDRGRVTGDQDPSFTSPDQAGNEARRQALGIMDALNQGSIMQGKFGTSEMMDKAIDIQGRPGGIRSLDPELLRAGLNDQQFFNFRQQMMEENPEAYRDAFPGASGDLLESVGGPLTGVLTGNPFGIIGNFFKDTMQNKLGVTNMDHGGDAGMEAGIAAKVNPAIMISINMGPKLPVNIQEIKEEKKMFKDDKMRASLSGQPNEDQVDLAPYMNTGI